MNLDILKKIKKHLLMLSGTYIYTSYNELDSVANWIVEYIKSLKKKKEQGILALEVQEGILHLVENFTDGYIVWFKIPLQNTEDFKKIYDVIKEKLNLAIGLHHSYGISRGGFDFNTFIDNRIVDLLSDNEFDKEWLRNYYIKDNEKYQIKEDKKNHKKGKIIKFVR